MLKFVELLRPTSSSRIADIGGSIQTWATLELRPKVTIVNLRRPRAGIRDHTHVRYHCADALNLPFTDDSFDIAFSNSVVEHMGTWSSQQRFAAEVRRLAPQLWIQTPARGFFIEPHLMTPLIHWLPIALRRRLIRWFTLWGWVAKPTRSEVTRFVDEVRLLTRKEMEYLFPDCRILTERWMGLPKSYVAYRAGD
jgi:hypothetical protein